MGGRPFRVSFFFRPLPHSPGILPKNGDLGRARIYAGGGKGEGSGGGGEGGEGCFSFLLPTCVLACAPEGERRKRRKILCITFWEKRRGERGRRKEGGEVLSNLLPRCIVVVERKGGERIAHVVSGRFIRLWDFFMGGDPRKKTFRGERGMGSRTMERVFVRASMPIRAHCQEMTISVLSLFGLVNQMLECRIIKSRLGERSLFDYWVPDSV